MAKELAFHVSLQLNTQAVSVHAEEKGWRVELSGGEHKRCKSLVLTAPVPQTLALLEAGHITLESSILKSLEAIAYDPCIAVMAVLDGPSGLPDEGADRKSVV